MEGAKRIEVAINFVIEAVNEATNEPPGSGGLRLSAWQADFQTS
jgi:hypothetical protein